MKISRRSFVASACSSACCASFPNLAVSAGDDQTAIPSEEIEICSTIEPTDGGLVIDNFSPTQQAIIEEFKITEYGTFLLPKRWRKSDGLTPNGNKITLGCYFMNGTPKQQKMVKDAAMEWLEGDLGKLIDFDFSVNQEESVIRINLGGTRNNSYLGRDNRKRSKSKATMNLANFNRSATVQHEFGHALGLRHEHLFPNGIQFNKDKVISDMKKRGWTSVMTYRNILTPLGENAVCVGDQKLNKESIMMYQIPSSWTKDGSSYQRAGFITQRDRNCVIAVYSL